MLSAHALCKCHTLPPLLPLPLPLLLLLLSPACCPVLAVLLLPPPLPPLLLLLLLSARCSRCARIASCISSNDFCEEHMVQRVGSRDQSANKSRSQSFVVKLGLRMAAITPRHTDAKWSALCLGAQLAIPSLAVQPSSNIVLCLSCEGAAAAACSLTPLFRACHSAECENSNSRPPPTSSTASPRCSVWPKLRMP